MGKTNYLVLSLSLGFIIVFGTEYFWEQLPGNFDFYIAFALIIWIFGLVLYVPNLLITWVKSNYSNVGALFNALLLITVFVTYMLNPNIIYYALVNDNDNTVLQAQSIGCFAGRTTLSLKDDHTFVMRSHSIREVDRELGTYTIANDTIYLTYLSRYDNSANPIVATIEHENHGSRLGYINIYSSGGLGSVNINLDIVKMDLE